MNNSDEKEQLLTQLIRETISGNIVWRVSQPPYSFRQATENYVPLYLETLFRNTRIGVYELREKWFRDEDEFHWSESLGVCIVHDPDTVVWRIEEYSPSLKELFNLARHQASGLRGLLGGP